jgi:hypothetical protein
MMVKSIFGIKGCLSSLWEMLRFLFWKFYLVVGDRMSGQSLEKNYSWCSDFWPSVDIWAVFGKFFNC